MPIINAFPEAGGGGMELPSNCIPILNCSTSKHSIGIYGSNGTWTMSYGGYYSQSGSSTISQTQPIIYADRFTFVPLVDLYVKSSGGTTLMTAYAGNKYQFRMTTSSASGGRTNYSLYLHENNSSSGTYISSAQTGYSSSPPITICTLVKVS